MIAFSSELSFSQICANILSIGLLSKMQQRIFNNFLPLCDYCNFFLYIEFLNSKQIFELNFCFYVCDIFSEIQNARAFIRIQYSYQHHHRSSLFLAFHILRISRSCVDISSKCLNYVCNIKWFYYRQILNDLFLVWQCGIILRHN